MSDTRLSLKRLYIDDKNHICHTYIVRKSKYVKNKLLITVSDDCVDESQPAADKFVNTIEVAEPHRNYPPTNCDKGIN